MGFRSWLKGLIRREAKTLTTAEKGYRELREILLVLERLNPEAMKCSREPKLIGAMLL